MMRLDFLFVDCAVCFGFKGRMATLSDETCFGDLFKRFAPFLKMYVEYCTQHENTASRVSLIASKNDKFGNLLHVSYIFYLISYHWYILLYSSPFET